MVGGGFRMGGKAGGLLVALATLSLPLLSIAVATFGYPEAAPAVDAQPEVAVLAPPLFAAEPEPGPPEPTTPLAWLSPAPQPPALDPLPRWTREDNLNVLVLGVDRRTPEEIYRTDTIVLASIDLRARRATLISIPRDLVVDIRGYGHDRINSVYAVGETQKRSGGGLALLRETVERDFGLPINHYAVVDFSCFRGAVDALGGVAVNVPERIHDPYYPTEDFGYKVVTFSPGRQWLDGERALEYARTRYGDTDFGRMRRQQQLLSALKEQALQVRTITALPRVVRACEGMRSDLSIVELVALGSAAREINQSDIALKVIDEQMAVPYIAPSGASVLLPRWDQIRAMVRSSVRGMTASASAEN